MKPIFKKFSIAFAVIVALFVFLLGGVGVTAVAANSALPGDTLYGVKTGMEQTRLRLTSEESQKVELNLSFAQKRLEEIEKLISNGRFEDLDEALKTYESYIMNALSGLETMRNSGVAVDPLLYAQVASSLENYALALNELSGRLASNERSAFEQAILFSQSAGTYHGEIEFVGVVDSMSTDVWTISGLDVVITAATEIESGIQVGQQVKVEGWIDAAGTIYAEEIDYQSDDDDFSFNDDSELTGVVNEIHPEYWIINGIRFELTSTTEIKDVIEVGDFVEVKFGQNEIGEWILLEVELTFDDDMDDMDDDDDMDDMDDDDDD